MDFNPRDNEDAVKAAGVIGLVAGLLRFIGYSIYNQSFSLYEIFQSLVFSIIVAVFVFIALKILCAIYDAGVYALNVIEAWIKRALSTAFELFLGLIWAIVIGLPSEIFRRLSNDREQQAEQRQERAGPGSQKRETPRQPPPQSNAEKDALELYELSRPYTLADIKRKRNALLLRVHPDHGGSLALTRQVNEAFELLKSRL